MGITASKIHLSTNLIENRTAPLLQSERNMFMALIDRICSLFYVRTGSVVHLERAIYQLKSSPEDLRAQDAYARVLVQRAFEMKTALPVHVVSSHILKNQLGGKYSDGLEKSVAQALGKAASEMATQTCEETLVLQDGDQASKSLSKIVRLGVWAVTAQSSGKDYQKALKVFFDHVNKTSTANLALRSQGIKNIEFKELLEQFIAEQLTPKTSWSQVGLRLISTAALVAGLYEAYHYYNTGETPLCNVLEEQTRGGRQTVQEWTNSTVEALYPSYAQVRDWIGSFSAAEQSTDTAKDTVKVDPITPSSSDDATSSREPADETPEFSDADDSGFFAND